MIGPACIVRKRIATPHAQSSPAMLIRSASVYMPNRSTRPAEDVHPGDQRDDGEHGRRHDPAHERRERVAEHDPGPVRRREQQPAREAGLEVARDPEAGEDAAERRRLEQDEAELERRVAGREVEARHVRDLREPAGERGEEEEREDQRRDEQRRVREDVLQRPPRDARRRPARVLTSAPAAA